MAFMLSANGLTASASMVRLSDRTRPASLTSITSGAGGAPAPRGWCSSFETCALPPVIGWTAAAGVFEADSLVLFGIVFIWQVPHFQSIAWIHREDYARAGFPVLPVVEPTGRRTVLQMIAYSLVLIPLSLLPTMFGIAGYIYYTGALILGFAFLAFGLEVARLRTQLSARQHMLASLAYLALLFLLMTVDKVGA